VGEVVEVTTERCSELPERFQQSYTTEPYTSLRCVCSNTVHGASSVADDALVENMEGAALFALARECGFRAVEIRAISNRVGESFEKWHLSEALDALTQTLQTLKL
jgi:uridine phosphorylase